MPPDRAPRTRADPKWVTAGPLVHTSPHTCDHLYGTPSSRSGGGPLDRFPAEPGLATAHLMLPLEEITCLEWRMRTTFG